VATGQVSADEETESRKQDLRLARQNQVAEYLRHITTLSTGSVVIISTFLEKIFTRPVWKAAIVVSLAGFILSILAATIVYSLALVYERATSDRESPGWVALVGGGSLFGTWIGFLIGIVGLSAFAVKNLLSGG
jgi:hypothetical protein